MKRLVTLGLVAGMIFAPGSELGSALENALFPVLVDSQITNITRRDGKEMCFTWTFEKARVPRQLFFLFYAVGSEDSDRSMLAARVMSDGPERPLRGAKATHARKIGSPRLCFSLPDYLTDDKVITIEGFVVYQGLLWRLPYKIGPVSASL